VARRLGADAFLKAVLHDGTAIHTVKHFGRHYPAELRTALDLGPVPEFTGRQCAQCGRRWGLQYDHIDPVAHRGPTSYDNIQALCWADHQSKTRRDHEAGLTPPHAPRGRAGPGP
jgi:5-methylcytosine-specific restriction endonuclease McrA